MADEKPKSNVDTTGYKSASISIPKANATFFTRVDSQTLTDVCGRMSLKARKFWALFWAQMFWLLCAAAIMLAAWQYAAMLAPACKAGSVEALFTDCSHE